MPKVCKQGGDDIIAKVNLQNSIPTSLYIYSCASLYICIDGVEWESCFRVEMWL